ncbi:hypothetical protein ACWEWX_02555 [Streptomyces asiaticus]|uniref:hypothetical protein n=1 Tax=Streptomyces TaxID=1883 RepID=UPI00369FDE8B
MIFHVSIEAQEPERVAKVIAELWQGSAAPLDRLVPGAWIAFCGKSALSSVEVFPCGTNITQVYGDEPWVGRSDGLLRPTASHVALSTELTKDAVFKVCAREGWKAKYVVRGDRFGVIEAWVNEYLVIEWLTTEMQAAYTRTLDGMLKSEIVYEA